MSDWKSEQAPLLYQLWSRLHSYFKALIYGLIQKVQSKHKSISGIIFILTGDENKLLEAWIATQSLRWKSPV